MFMIRRVAVGAAVVVMACCWASLASAEWGISLDAPLTYYFDSPEVTRPPAGNSNPVLWKSPEPGKVEGFLLSIVAPPKLFGIARVGVGLEDYSVTAPVLVTGCPAPCDVTVKLDLEIYDLFLDIPTELLNFGAGYGQGNGKISVKVPPTIPPVTIANPNVYQWFVSLGAILGRFDLHLAYHWVSVQEVAISGGGNNPGQPPDHFRGSGRMMSLGARVNF